MSLSRILVPVEAGAHDDANLSLAIGLANEFGAKLIGLGAEAMHTPVMAGPFSGSAYASVHLMDYERQRLSEELQAAEAKFRAAAVDVTGGFEWRSAVGLPIVVMASAARTADVIIASLDGRERSSAYSVAAPAALVLQAGRPVLFAPRSFMKLELGTVLVAWKDTREARRATADALPLLKLAGSVVVAEVCERGDSAGADARIADVVDFLSSHDIAAWGKACPDQEGVNSAQQLLELAAELNAGLVVAGAFGHSRLQEWVFGGFTRALLQQTDRAVLLSH